VNVSEWKIIILILAMGAATYLTRMMGYWLAGRFRVNKALEIWLGYLPGCILISLVAPFVLNASWLEYLAAGLTAFLMWRTHSILLSMVAGLGLVALGRFLFF
jgi:uncharacterized membrane protein